MHQVDHMLRDLEVERINPKVFWNFANEDFVGKIKKIARKCHRKTLAECAMQRYMLKISLRWLDRGDVAWHAKVRSSLPKLRSLLKSQQERGKVKGCTGVTKKFRKC